MFFPGGAIGPGVVLNALVYAVTSGEGIVKVVGEVGSGKTMLCRMLEERLPDAVEIVYIANPSLSARDIIYAIAFELDLDVDAATERLMVMHKLQDYLVKKHSEGGTVVVFIEEAQGMPIETLEEIRLLSNLETHRHKLMQIILFGQPELDKNLQGKNIRQVRERITHSLYLEPMTLEQTSDYLHYRMQAAGCPWPQVFTKKAEKLLNKASEGLTRRVNILADKSLMAAYASSTIQPGHQFGAIQQKVLPQHVKAAIKDSGYGMRHLLPWTALVTGFGVIILAFALYLGINAYQPEQAFRPVQANRDAAGNIPRATENQAEIAREITVIQGANEEVSRSLQDQIDIIESAAVIEGSIIQVPNQGKPDPESSESMNGSLISVSATDVGQAEIEIADNQIPESEFVSIETEVVEAVETDATLASMSQTPSRQTQERQEAREDISEGMAAEITPEFAEESLTIVEIEALVENDRQNQPLEQASGNKASDKTAFSELPGLIGVRARASSEWLQNIANKNAYTVQMAAFPIADQPMLEEYLQLLSLTELLDETYLCLISRTSNRAQQWLVIHGDFTGVSRARGYIESLPIYSRQYEPFARNSETIACLSDAPEGSLLAFLNGAKANLITKKRADQSALF